MSNITGKVIKIFPEQEITSAFKKREFVIETDEAYPQILKLETTGKHIDLLDKIKEGQTVDVHFNIKGKEYTKDGKTSYFMSLSVWRLSELKGMPDKKEVKPVEKFKPDYAGSGLDPLCDDLPF